MKKLMTLLAVLMVAGVASAALMTNGYTIGSGLLTPNGETLFYDAAAGGGTDIQDADGDSGTAAAFIDGVANNFWSLGDTVEITGIALRLQGFTTNGTFTFTLYPAAGGVGETKGGGFTDSPIASTTATFNGFGVNGEYWVNFDDPLSFTVGASTTAVGLHFKNSGQIRYKALDGYPVTRYNIFNGNIPGGANTNGFNMSIAGTVVPEPATMGLMGVAGVALMAVRTVRRRARQL